MKDKEKRITINREAGAMVDLLNNEIEELQKASAIEEMARKICIFTHHWKRYKTCKE